MTSKTILDKDTATKLVAVMIRADYPCTSCCTNLIELALVMWPETNWEEAVAGLEDAWDRNFAKECLERARS